ncbi:MAG: hypothetical protein ABI548_25265 [Polyangiaceae bacterium]
MSSGLFKGLQCCIWIAAGFAAGCGGQAIETTHGAGGSGTSAAGAPSGGALGVSGGGSAGSSGGVAVCMQTATCLPDTHYDESACKCLPDVADAGADGGTDSGFTVECPVSYLPGAYYAIDGKKCSNVGEGCLSACSYICTCEATGDSPRWNCVALGCPPH